MDVPDVYENADFELLVEDQNAAENRGQPTAAKNVSAPIVGPQTLPFGKSKTLMI